MVEKMAILINLNDARKKLNELEGSAEYNKGVTDAFNALFDLPTIETEPKHGHWIKVDKHTVKCSECGNYLDMRGVNAGRGDANYCPNCGNPMDGVTEKEKSNAEERYNPCLTCSQINNTFCDCSKR